MKEITELLEKLASKLGTTVEQLWKILLEQTKIIFWEMVAYSVVAILFLIAAIYFIPYALNGIAGLPDTNTPFADGVADDKLGYTVLLITSIMYLTIVPFILINNFKKIMTMKRNPGYWALEQVLGALK